LDLSYIAIDHVCVAEAAEAVSVTVSFSCNDVVFVDEANDLVDVVLVVFDKVVVDFVEVLLVVDDLEVLLVVAALAAFALQMEIQSDELQYAEVVPHRPSIEH
jgi:hypothetical protein